MAQPDRSGAAGGGPVTASPVRRPDPAPGTSRGFLIVTAVLGVFLFAAAAPSPLYGLYAERWHFSSTNLTAVFAVYALALLATLLVAGTLSDAIGRRPVIWIGLGLMAVSLALFLAADGLAWLYAARVVQGVATGLVTAAVAAALIDLQPADRSGIGNLVNAVTPTLGLAAGALVSGALVQYAPQPTRLVYAALLLCVAVLAVAMLAVPEPVTERRRPSLSVRIGVEPAVRPAFLAATPCLGATWALGGLYLSLGPSIAGLLTGSTNRLVGGSVVTVLAGAGGLASLAARHWPARRAMFTGCGALAAGVTVTVAAVASGSTGSTGVSVAFYAGTLIAGFGFGTSFLGAFRTIAALASPAGRAGVVTAVYVVAYLAFSVPAVIAGILVTHVGLRDTAVGYGAVIAALALLAAPTTARATRPASSR